MSSIDGYSLLEEAFVTRILIRKWSTEKLASSLTHDQRYWNRHRRNRSNDEIRRLNVTYFTCKAELEKRLAGVADPVQDPLVSTKPEGTSR